MGEAKRRGSFEKRQTEGIVKNFKKARDRAIREAEYEASLTLEQKQKRHNARMLLATALGIGASASPIVTGK